MLIKLDTQEYPVAHQTFRERFPQTSFPLQIDYAAWGYAVVFPAPQGALSNPVTKRWKELAPVLTTKGHYEQVWEEVDVYADTETQTKAEQEGEVIAAAQAKAVQDLQDGIVTAVQARLDTFAQTRNYDGILSACTYASSTVPKFAAEGQCAVNARDATWATLYTLLAEIQAGTRAIPSSYADIEPLLPALTWGTT